HRCLAQAVPHASAHEVRGMSGGTQSLERAGHGGGPAPLRAQPMLRPRARALVGTVHPVVQSLLQRHAVAPRVRFRSWARAVAAALALPPILPAGLAPKPCAAQEADSLGVRPGFWLDPAQEGAWLRSDHLQHTSLSFTIGLGAGLATGEPAVAASALALGIAKEVFDSRRAGASKRDLVADLVGTALAVAAVAAFTR